MAADVEKTIEKDLGALRQEYQQLSTTISRLDLLRLVLLFLFAVALSSAFDRVDIVDNAKIDKARIALTQKLSEIVALNESPRFDPTPFLAGYCPDPGRYIKSLGYYWSAAQESRLTASEGDVSALMGNLCSLYQQEFTFPLDVLGVKVELDLRHWVFGLPFLYWFSTIYVQLLKKKLRLLELLAGILVAASPPGQVLTLDRLLFSAKPQEKRLYARLPWQFVKPFYWLA